MSSVLFVSNGHGEVAISARIARDLSGVRCDHLALVGALEPLGDRDEWPMHEVGPRRAMPSGGLVAMGNLPNIVRDLRAGLLAHTFAQLRFLRGARDRYDTVVAVGDVFALIMALQVGAPNTIFVGTAKSVYYTPYGPMEERVIRKARAVFVRDELTARRLGEHGIAASAANVIVDLYENGNGERVDTGFAPLLALFPGSRESAYEDAVRICRVLRELARRRPAVGGVLSIAPAIDAARMAHSLREDGWSLEERADPLQPFSCKLGDREIVRAWRGSLGAMIAAANAVLGQAGTANEAAAAAGLPVIAYEPEHGPPKWYRKRQMALLGDALLVVHGDPASAAQAVNKVLVDGSLCEQMALAGRERMGPRGGAASIARAIRELTGSPVIA
jgi:uncharacterized protein (TIGR03492 family)